MDKDDNLIKLINQTKKLHEQPPLINNPNHPLVLIKKQQELINRILLPSKQIQREINQIKHLQQQALLPWTLQQKFLSELSASIEKMREYTTLGTELAKQFSPHRFAISQLHDSFQVHPFFVHSKSVSFSTDVEECSILDTLTEDVLTSITPDVQIQKLEKLRQFVIAKVPRTFIPNHLAPFILVPIMWIVAPEKVISVASILITLYLSYQSSEQAERHHQEKMEQGRHYYEKILKKDGRSR